MNILTLAIISALQTDTLSLDSACIYFNGCNNTIIVNSNDSVLDYTSLKIITKDDSTRIGFPAYKFTMFLKILKFTEDSLKMNDIRVLKNEKVSFLFKNKKVSTSELIKKILSNKKLRDVYIFYCNDMIRTQMTEHYAQLVFGIKNEEFIDSEASYFGILKLHGYLNVRDTILKSVLFNY